MFGIFCSVSTRFWLMSLPLGNETGFMPVYILPTKYMRVHFRKIYFFKHNSQRDTRGLFSNIFTITENTHTSRWPKRHKFSGSLKGTAQFLSSRIFYGGQFAFSTTSLCLVWRPAMRRLGRNAGNCHLKCFVNVKAKVNLFLCFN
jgi:hypothetical protein